MTMKFVDSHTHAWGSDTDELPWQADIVPPGWDGSYRVDALVADMDAASVDEAVVVTTPMYGRGARANEYTMRAIEAYRDRLWGVGLLDFFQDDPEHVRMDVCRVVGDERMLGFRIHACFAYEEHPTVLNPKADWILDERLDPVWEEAAAHDAAAFLFPKTQQLSILDDVVTAHPDMTFVIDHMAFPDETTDPEAAPWTDFQALAKHENVAVKVSSIPRSSGTVWPYEDLHEYVRKLVEWFGPERLMLGSDYPWMDDWAEYESCLSWIEECEFLSARDYSYLTHRSFEQVHGV